MTGRASETEGNFAALFDRRIKEVLASEANRVRVGELAYEYYKKSFGCSQSLLQAFQDVLEIRDEFWFRAMGGLQGGGSCGLTCGALAAGFVLISAKVGRARIDQGLEAILPAFEPCHQLTLWFKPMFKSTVCSEITGVNWFDMNEVVGHYLGPKGPETIEKCALLTGSTATRVAEILSRV
ncbi:MAG: C-GCAxxG-C-C family protein [Dehalococcoidia bacterium]|nr:C-GCAxxG-C-C family protein [Dehalococcoidia bacterium]